MRPEKFYQEAFDLTPLGTSYEVALELIEKEYESVSTNQSLRQQNGGSLILAVAASHILAPFPLVHIIFIRWEFDSKGTLTGISASMVADGP